MLIVLSGVETVNKRLFSGKIIAALNAFEVDGYRIDFTKTNVEVSDTDGNIVWAVGQSENSLLSDKDGFANPAGIETANKIIALQDEVFTVNILENHYANIFSEPTVDYGFLPPTELHTRESGYNLEHSYDLLVQRYNARTFDNFVITGSFSKMIIDQLRSDLGGENVLVLNIIRNPSTCFLLNEKAPEYYIDQADRTPGMDIYKLQKSILNAIILRNLEGAVTLKFEDMIADGTFNINGVNISVPDGYLSYNDILTQWEKDNIIPMNIVDSNELTAVNQFYSDYAVNLEIEVPTDISTDDKQAMADSFSAQYGVPITIELAEQMLAASLIPGPKKLQDILPFWNAVHNTTITEEQVLSQVPSNLFASLDYTPLSYDTIINPK